MPDEDPDRIEEAEPPFDAVQAAAEFAAAMAEEPSSPQDDDAFPPGQDRYTSMLEDEVEALHVLVAEKEQALAEMEQTLAAAEQRATAVASEVDRVRARLEGSANATIEQKRRSVIASFLDVADALDRAVSEMAKGGVAPALAQGVHAVRSELHNVLGRHGAKHRPALGLEFDSAHHEAIAVVPATADAPDGTITAVLSEGYEIGEHTLRVARVVVAKG